MDLIIPDKYKYLTPEQIHKNPCTIVPSPADHNKILIGIRPAGEGMQG
jgi:hypothetical protein